jgi:hypothetical protein
MSRAYRYKPLYGYGAMQGAGGGSGFSLPLGASFDGTNDYLLRGSDLTGNADGTTGIFACRLRFNGGNGTKMHLYASTSETISIYKDIDNKIYFRLRDSVGTDLILLNSTSTYTADGYVNILCSWDTSADANNYLYIDDAPDLTLAARLAGTLDYTVAEHAIAAYYVGGLFKLNADINFMYLNLATGIDFSIESNRRKFFDSQGSPVLAPYGNGSEATGTSPIIYQAGDYTQWEDNKGTGGGFTVTGALERPAA